MHSDSMTGKMVGGPLRPPGRACPGAWGLSACDAKPPATPKPIRACAGLAAKTAAQVAALPSVSLDADPLADIKNSMSVRYVMVNGRIYDAATMAQLGNHPAPAPRPTWRE